MSFAVDDLVSSFNASHIGQEAIDLAALQAQLAQSLFAHSHSPAPQQIPRRAGQPQPCNTPTARTPTSSFYWDGSTRRRSSSVVSTTTSRPADDIREMDLEDVEDERMVEDLLGQSSSSMSQRVYAQPLSPAPSFRHRSPSVAHAFPSPAFASSPAFYDQSLFTNTDPFYVAVVQASQHHTPSTSFFAQAARPSHNSPFFKAASQPQPIHAMGMEVDSRPLLAGAPGMFDR